MRGYPAIPSESTSPVYGYLPGDLSSYLSSDPAILPFLTSVQQSIHPSIRAQTNWVVGRHDMTSQQYRVRMGLGLIHYSIAAAHARKGGGGNDGPHVVGEEKEKRRLSLSS